MLRGVLTAVVSVLVISAPSRARPDGAGLTLPVEVSVDGDVKRVSLEAGSAQPSVPEAADVEIDPLGWLLKR